MEKNATSGAECLLSEVELFEPAYVQAVIQSGQMEEHFPLNSIADGGPIEFHINNTSDQFIDLAYSYLRVRLRILKGDHQSMKIST